MNEDTKLARLSSLLRDSIRDMSSGDDNVAVCGRLILLGEDGVSIVLSDLRGTDVLAIDIRPTGVDFSDTNGVLL